MRPEERLTLIDALLDGVISEADFLRLEADMHVDPEARRDYYARQKLHVLLETEAGSAFSDLAPKSEPEGRRSDRGGGERRTRLVLGLGVTMGLALLMGIAGFHRLRPATELPEAVSQGYAVIAGENAAVWDGGQQFRSGDLLPAGWRRLVSGAVQLELFSGVTLVIEGEARFALESSMEMEMKQGKLRAKVPDAANGFRVRTPKGEAVDLGTEFALEVGPSESELHVLDGEVEWHHGSDEMTVLTEGKSLHSEALEKRASADPDRFLSVDVLQERLVRSREDRRRQWERERERIDADPRTLVHYTVGASQVRERRLVNRSPGPGGEAAIVGSAPVPDRFDYPSAALDFSQAGSRLRLQVPGVHGSLTLLAWVKINSLDRWFNSLLLTDGHDLGEPHWQILEDGRLFFSVKCYTDRDGGADKHIFYSPPFWKPELAGRWVMLATVYDLERGRVLHTLDGRLLSEEAIPADYRVESVRIGAASIGNWGEPAYRKDPAFAVRNLNGSLDEFILWGGALRLAEIEKLYAAGRP